MKQKIAIITTHPIQYYAPLFAQLSKSAFFDFHVYYSKGDAQNYQFDVAFGKNISWDIPLLDGYAYTFLENTSKNAKKGGFWSIKNPKLITEIKKFGADAILIFGWNYQSHFEAMRYFKGKIPVFFRGDSTLLDKSSVIKKHIRTFFLTYIFKHIDYAFYVGQSNKQYFLEMGITENKLIYSPHSIDNQRFNSISEEQNIELKQLKTKLQINESQKVMLFCGKFIYKKNPILLIESFLEANFKDVHLVLVGNGELEKIIIEKTKNIPNMHLLPFQNQSKMPIIYRLADVFCLPSSGPGETWGLAANEAMASGKIVVLSNKCGSAADLILENKTGFVFESENKNDLTEKLKKAIELSSVNDIENMQKNFIKNWDIEETAQKMVQGLMNKLPK